MTTKNVFKIILLFLVLFLSLTSNTSAGFKYSFHIEPSENQLFPAMLAISQTINFRNEKNENLVGDPAGPISLKIMTEQKMRGKFTISSSTLIKPSVITFNLEPSEKFYTIRPLIEYDYAVLYKIRQPQPEVIKFMLEVEGAKGIIQTRKVLVRSLNDCPTLFKDSMGNLSSFNFIFAAFVNEHHPVVDEILRKALDTGIIRSFHGYQGTPEQVSEEIFAVWNALQREKVQYSNLWMPSALSDEVHSQHVRFIQDSFKNAQANCVDGSVLFASVFTKLGLYTELIFPPGHCLLTVYLEPPQKDKKPNFICLETTMIGIVDLDKFSIRDTFYSLMGKKNYLSRHSFNYAVKVGGKKYNAIEEWKKDTKVPVLLARKIGIIPLKDIFSGENAY
ncbi:MAG: hypothetical protein K9L30_05000 [Desulfobacterales bacterium]|nr:hypothetical protein [Desulfobacterales bacterium]